MKKIFFILFFFNLITCLAQQLPQLSLRSFDYTVFNPATNGTKPYSEVMLHHRSQWVGFTNAPSTQFLTYNGKINEIMGIGSYIMNDITGPTRRFAASVAYNYKAKFENLRLSIGLAAGIMQYGIDGNKISLYQHNDNIVAERISMKSICPNVDFGVLLYNDKFYTGISIMQLLANKIKFNAENINTTINLTNHFYITSGYKIELNKEILLQPSFLVGGTIGTPLLIDFGLRTDFQEKITAGIGFRTNDAIVLLAGVKIKNQFTIAYSYDIVFSTLRKYNSGSHDIILSFYFLQRNKRGKFRKYH